MSMEAGEFKGVRQEAYDGASEHYRLEQKGLVFGSQDDLAARELYNLWARSHHASRNDGTIATAKLKYRENLGAVKVVWKNKNGKVNKKVQALWDTFADDPNLDGYGNLDNTQDNWNAAMFSSGEALTRMIIKRRKGHKIPLVLQQIESEFLDPLYNAGDPENTKNSITFKESRPHIYHFLKKLKGVISFGVADAKRVKVPAEDIIHIFIRERPGSWRGIPKPAPILLPSYELADLTDATVNKQINSQAVSWIVKNSNATASIAIGTNREVGDPADLDESGNKRRVFQSSAANVQYLNKNEDLIPVQGADIGDNLDVIVRSELRKIAKTCGITYEVLTGDLTGISFSALKFVVNEMRTSAHFIYQFYTINLGLTPLCRKFKELVEIFEGTTFEHVNPCFEYPKRLGIDELKDTQADLLAVTSKMGTLGRVLAKNNLTFDDIKEDMAKMKELGIVLVPEVQTGNVKPNTNSAEI